MLSINPTGIILHRCETGETGEQVKAAEAKRGLGYHYFVRRGGLVDCLYPPDVLVWHALHYSHSCIGIALHGDFVPADRSKYCNPTAEQLASTATLAVTLWHRFGPLPLMGHTDLAGASTDPLKVCPGANLDVRALQAHVYTAFGLAPLVVPLA